MGLLDEVRAATTDPRIRPCGIATFIDNLDGADRADVLVALADPSMRASAIYAVLVKRGLTMRYDSLGRHRRGTCGCSR